MTTNIITEEHPEYLTWVYNKIEGEMQSKIVNAETAEELFEDGWRLSPAEFAEDDSLKESPEFQAVADDMAAQLNILLNIDKIEDKEKLVEFAQDFLKLKIHPNTKINTLRKRINKKADELGLFE